VVKFPNPKRKSGRKRFCSSISIHQSDLTAVKINAKLPPKRLLPQPPLIIQNLALAFQLPSQVLKKDVPYGKIIQALVSTKPFEMLPGFSVPIPGIVVLTAGPVIGTAFDFDPSKMGH